MQLAFVNERLLADDAAKLERLRNFYRNRPPVFENDWRRVLHQAADILDHLGWCRGALERDAHYCAVGAIIAAYSHGDLGCEDYANSMLLRVPMVQDIIGKVETCLHRKRESDSEDLMDWNDAVARSGKQVAALLRRTVSQN
jgi:hypothetical protein